MVVIFYNKIEILRVWPMSQYYTNYEDVLEWFMSLV